jgi:bifunctional UDP-N-acetylglucosamine pyrophosphorylase / glucosamine-1-phosphate N-acetyltransferase
MRAVILAAGKGKRMKSALPKVLHKLCGRTLFEHVLAAVRDAGAKDVVAVVSPDSREAIEAFGVRTVVQQPPSGTGHAAQIALAAMPGDDAVLIVSADMPLLPAALLRAVAEIRKKTGAVAALLTADVPLPTSFGRILRESGRIARIVEQSDATPDQQLVTEVNAGVYCFDAPKLREYLTRLDTSNAQQELYLTDCIGLAVASGELVEAVTTRDHRDVMGVNNRAELARARAIMQKRILRAHMLAGVTVVDPATTYVDVGVALSPDVTLLPQTHVLGTSQVGRGTTIGPNTSVIDAVIGERASIGYSVVRDSIIGPGVTVGPFAHIRGGSTVHDGVHIGNFVELKNTEMGEGTKAGHLSYLGDADIGAGANIGAGTITCNYDGKQKHKTAIGRGAFIGSHSSLVAPVEIGDGALTGAGSVVTRDVAAGERVAGNPARPLQKKDQT